MASTYAGKKRPRVAGTTGSFENQQVEPGRLWVSGYPRAILETTRRSTWTLLEAACPQHLLSGTTT
eukprot:7976771-Pyramimonas_sp.AAC.1